MERKYIPCFVDIDECAEGTAGCTHGCKNTAGSYQCLCPEGRIGLGDDQRTCIGEYIMYVFGFGGSFVNGLC